jgi:cbb3-type cytochrome oxidase subunit 3
MRPKDRSSRPMSHTVATTWFVSLMVMAIAYLGLVFWLLRRLRLRHRSTYEKFGPIDLFDGPFRKFRKNWLFLAFLFTSQSQSLDDPALSAVARVMRVVFVVCTTSFLGFVAVAFFMGISSA